MGLTYLNSLTGSVSTRPAIQMLVDGPSTGKKYLELLRKDGISNPTSIFYVTDDGDVYLTGDSTSSYVKQKNNTTNQIAYYDGTKLVGGSGLIFQNAAYGGQYKILNVSSSLPYNAIAISSKGGTYDGDKLNQSSIRFWNLNGNRGPDTYPNADGWILGSGLSGSLTLFAGKQSYQFSSSNTVSQGGNTLFSMVQVRNGFYFWPYMAASTPSRDGAIGIGVQPPIEPTGSFNKYLRAKLHINMFSGSGEGPWSVPGTVEHRNCAILVQYGSGSATTSVNNTFYVSSSGVIYSRALGTGTVYSSNGVLTNTNPSDGILKENIQYLSYGLNEVNSLNPIKFNYVNNDPSNIYFDDSTKLGFLASEVRDVIPEIVKTNRGIQGIDVVSLIPVLVNAIKELRDEVESLKLRLS
jgi:hypothetical protein